MDDFLNFILAQSNKFIYFAMFLSVPSVLLYCAEIVTILRHKCFHTSFHALFVIRSIPDLLYTLDSYYGFRLPNLFGRHLLDFYQKLPNFSLALFCFLTNYTLQVDNLTTVFILFHRFTAIAIPIRHEKLWAKWLLPLAILVSFCLPLYSLELFKMEAEIFVMKESKDGDIHFVINEAQNGTLLKPYIKINAISSVLFLLICTFINVACLSIYRKRQLPAFREQNSAETGEIERKLLVYAILTFFGHMLIAILLICLAIFIEFQNTTLLAVANTQYPWIVDLGTVVLPSWLILWASPNFRQHLFADFLPKCFSKNFHTNSAVGPINAHSTVKRASWTEGIK